MVGRRTHCDHVQLYTHALSVDERINDLLRCDLHAVPLLTSFYNPHSQGAHFALIIGVILASVYFGKRILLLVVVVIYGGLFSLYFTQSESAQHLLFESMAILAVTCTLHYYGSMFHEWLDQHHQRSLKEQLERFEQLLSASFQGTARLLDGKLAEVSTGFMQVLDETEDELNDETTQ